MTDRTTKPILCLAITPAVQRTLFVEGFRPGEVNRARRVRVTASGKGVNVALAIARLGSPARLAGFAGGDPGRFIAEEIAHTGIDARWVDLGSPTRHCHTLVETDTGRVTELVEESAAPAAWAELEAAFDDAVRGCAWSAVSGAMPPSAPAGQLLRFVTRASATGVPTCVDTQGPQLLECLPARPAIVKLNTEELRRTCATDAIDDGARRLLDGGAGTVLVTDGPRSARLYTSRGIHAIPAPHIRPVNPIGSGDCVTAGLLHALAGGEAMIEAARFGIACGSANAETETPAEIDSDRVRELWRAMPRDADGSADS